MELGLVFLGNEVEWKRQKRAQRVLFYSFVNGINNRVNFTLTTMYSAHLEMGKALTIIRKDYDDLLC